jgi:hypothetical protein
MHHYGHLFGFFYLSPQRDATRTSHEGVKMCGLGPTCKSAVLYRTSTFRFCLSRKRQAVAPRSSIGVLSVLVQYSSFGILFGVQYKPVLIVVRHYIFCRQCSLLWKIFTAVLEASMAVTTALSYRHLGRSFWLGALPSARPPTRTQIQEVVT